MRKSRLRTVRLVPFCPKHLHHLVFILLLELLHECLDLRFALLDRAAVADSRESRVDVVHVVVEIPPL